MCSICGFTSFKDQRLFKKDEPYAKHIQIQYVREKRYGAYLK